MLTDEAKAHVLRYVHIRLPNQLAPRKADRKAAQAEWRKLRRIFADAGRDELAVWYADAATPARRAIVQVMANVRPADKDHSDISAMICAVTKGYWGEQVARIQRRHAEQIDAIAASHEKRIAELDGRIAEERDSCERTARDLLEVTEQRKEQRSNAARHMEARKQQVIQKKRAQDETVKVKAEAYDLTRELATARSCHFRERALKNTAEVRLGALRGDLVCALRRSDLEQVQKAVERDNERIARDLSDV